MHKVEAPVTESELMLNANNMAGKSIKEIAHSLDVPMPNDLTIEKGWLGQMIEKALGATAQSRPEPDFVHLGIELKTIPITASFKPIESTFICSINLQKLTSQQWDNSLVKKKLNKVLWVPILENDSLADRVICTPILWTMSKNDEAIIRNDWQELTDLLAMGQAEEVHGSQGVYLQVRPKADNSKARTLGYNSEGELADTLPRGFYLRSKFTTNIISDYYL